MVEHQSSQNSFQEMLVLSFAIHINIKLLQCQEQSENIRGPSNSTKFKLKWYSFEM